MHIINACNRMLVRDKFCQSMIASDNITEKILPLISLFTSLISFTRTLTAQKKIFQYDEKLNAFQTGYLFVMVIFL